MTYTETQLQEIDYKFDQIASMAAEAVSEDNQDALVGFVSGMIASLVYEIVGWPKEDQDDTFDQDLGDQFLTTVENKIERYYEKNN